MCSGDPRVAGARRWRRFAATCSRRGRPARPRSTACAAPDGSVVFLSVSVPGPDKRRPGLFALQRLAAEALERALPVTPLESGRDAARPVGGVSRAPSARPRQARHRRSRGLPSGRPARRSRRVRPGRRAGRSGVASPARAPVPGVRPSGRGVHPAARGTRRPTSSAAADAAPRPRCSPSSLVAGARDRTRADAQARPRRPARLRVASGPVVRRDVAVDRPAAGVLRRPARPSPTRSTSPACVEAGVRAERRMIADDRHERAQGLHLPGRPRPARGQDRRRARTTCGGRSPALARADPRPASPQDDPGRVATPSHGARARADHAVGGIYREALLGLPSVFERGLPVLAAARRRLPSAHRGTG